MLWWVIVISTRDVKNMEAVWQVEEEKMQI